MHLTKRAIATLLVAGALAASGCGSEGAAGAGGAAGGSGATGDTGATGGAGSPGRDAFAQPKVEGCSSCHAAGREADFAALHAVTGDVVVTGQTIAVAANGTDLSVTFNV